MGGPRGPCRRLPCTPASPACTPASQHACMHASRGDFVAAGAPLCARELWELRHSHRTPALGTQRGRPPAGRPLADAVTGLGHISPPPFLENNQLHCTSSVHRKPLAPRCLRCVAHPSPPVPLPPTASMAHRRARRRPTAAAWLSSTTRRRCTCPSGVAALLRCLPVLPSCTAFL